MSFRLAIMGWKHLASLKLAVFGTFSERGLCCLYNLCIFVPMHQKLFNVHDCQMLEPLCHHELKIYKTRLKNVRLSGAL